MQETIATVAIAFLVAVSAIVAFKLVSGAIRMRGLLDDKETGTFSPARLQLLIITLAGAASYFGLVVESAGAGALPAVPAWLLIPVAASNAGYLGAKIRSRFLRRISQS